MNRHAEEHPPIDVLLVEDSDNDIVIVKEAFEEAKLINIVDVVRDGEEALMYLNQQAPYQDRKRPGLVLLDINLPKKNGFEVLHEMKQDKELKIIPVVMLTTSTSDEDVIKSYDEGACTYISKPVSSKELCAAIREFSIYWAMVARVPRRT